MAKKKTAAISKTLLKFEVTVPSCLYKVKAHTVNEAVQLAITAHAENDQLAYNVDEVALFESEAPKKKSKKESKAKRVGKPLVKGALEELEQEGGTADAHDESDDEDAATTNKTGPNQQSVS